MAATDGIRMGSKASHAEMHMHEGATPETVAYAAFQVVFALTDIENFAHTRGALFSYRKFFRSVLSLFDVSSEWAARTLDFLTRKLPASRFEADSSDESDNDQEDNSPSAMEQMREQLKLELSDVESEDEQPVQAPVKKPPSGSTRKPSRPQKKHAPLPNAPKPSKPKRPTQTHPPPSPPRHSHPSTPEAAPAKKKKQAPLRSLSGEESGESDDESDDPDKDEPQPPKRTQQSPRRPSRDAMPPPPAPPKSNKPNPKPLKKQPLKRALDEAEREESGHRRRSTLRSHASLASTIDLDPPQRLKRLRKGNGDVE